MTFLLDVNVVIALIDAAHNFHDSAHQWFSAHRHLRWATCPLTENGVLRILGNPGYRNYSGSQLMVVDALSDLCSLPGHEFWPDDISMLDEEKIDLSRLLTSGQVTDSYLLALAIAHGGQLATFDRRLSANVVRNGASGIHLIQ
jgi:toxin-antitoxin system PIN domain toxin